MAATLRGRGPAASAPEAAAPGVPSLGCLGRSVTHVIRLLSGGIHRSASTPLPRPCDGWQHAHEWRACARRQARVVFQDDVGPCPNAAGSTCTAPCEGEGPLPCSGWRPTAQGTMEVPGVAFLAQALQQTRGTTTCPWVRVRMSSVCIACSLRPNGSASGPGGRRLPCLRGPCPTNFSPRHRGLEACGRRPASPLKGHVWQAGSEASRLPRALRLSRDCTTMSQCSGCSACDPLAN